MSENQYPRIKDHQLRGVVRTKWDHPTPTKEQQKRKATSIAKIQALGLPFIEHLPVIEAESSIQWRTDIEVAKRAIALMICALKGETQGQEPDFIKQVIDDCSAESFFTENELLFLGNEAPSEQELIDNCWAYECLHTLLWGLGHDLNMDNFAQTSDAGTCVKIVHDIGPDRFLEEAKLRHKAEILDVADLYYRAHWAAVQLRLEGKNSSAIDASAIDEGITLERLRALNWLTSHMDRDWDNVRTDT